MQQIRKKNINITRFPSYFSLKKWNLIFSITHQYYLVFTGLSRLYKQYNLLFRKKLFNCCNGTNNL